MNQKLTRFCSFTATRKRAFRNTYTTARYVCVCVCLCIYIYIHMIIILIRI